MYASAGIDEYWVVDIAGARVIVHRAPEVNGYAERFDVIDRVRPAAIELPALDIPELLATD